MRQPCTAGLMFGLSLFLTPIAIAQEKEEDVTEEHTVVPGDTLWDLCGRYLNNSWYWPRVWSYNPEISNPHWIYPGQVVRFYPGGEGPGQMDLISRDFNGAEPPPIEVEEQELSPEDLVSMTGDYVRAKKYAVMRIKRNTFITESELKAMGRIRASRSEKQLLSKMDRLYLRYKKGSQPQVGTLLSIYRTERKIHHPVTGKSVGYLTRVLGACKITNLTDRGPVAEITESYESIERGDRIGPLMENLTRQIKPQPNGVELKGYIVGSSRKLTFFGESQFVFIDQGSQQGVQEGNLFDVVRRQDSNTDLGDTEAKWDKRMPEEIWGRIMVVDARKRASTGIVVASLRELHVGDHVQMRIR